MVVMQKGRACEDCHGSKNANKVQDGRINLTWLENQQVVRRIGMIPVVDGVDYDCVYQNFADGQWAPIKKPLRPVVQYAAFGEPLTPEQLNKLAATHKIPPPKMN